MTCRNHAHCRHQALIEAEQLCQQHGLRFTPARKEIFSIIWGSHKALTAAEIMEKLGNNHPPVTYRALDFLVKNNLIHHVTSLNSYVGCSHISTDEHIGQLLICSHCRHVLEVDSRPLLGHLHQTAKNNGFAIEQTHIEVLGLCKSCQSQLTKV